MSEHKTFSVSLELEENYVFKLDFGAAGYIFSDEPPPLGQGEGPNPSMLLGSAVANCLCASLLFALRKKKQELPGLKAHVEGGIARKDGFWRISHINVGIEADTAQVDEEALAIASQQFENFCIVTQSVKDGIPIHVSLTDQNNKSLLNRSQ